MPPRNELGCGRHAGRPRRLRAGPRRMAKGQGGSPDTGMSRERPYLPAYPELSPLASAPVPLAGNRTMSDVAAMPGAAPSHGPGPFEGSVPRLGHVLSEPAYAQDPPSRGDDTIPLDRRAGMEDFRIRRVVVESGESDIPCRSFRDSRLPPSPPRGRRVRPTRAARPRGRRRWPPRRGRGGRSAGGAGSAALPGRRAGS